MTLQSLQQLARSLHRTAVPGTAPFIASQTRNLPTAGMDCDPCIGQRRDVDVTGVVRSTWARSFYLSACSHVYFLRKLELQHVCAGIKSARSMVLTHNTAACIWMKQNRKVNPFRLPMQINLQEVFLV